MVDGTSEMRETVSQAASYSRAASESTRPSDRVHTFAVYGAFALIATIVFGTLSYHPF